MLQSHFFKYIHESTQKKEKEKKTNYLKKLTSIKPTFAYSQNRSYLIKAFALAQKNWESVIAIEHC